MADNIQLKGNLSEEDVQNLIQTVQLFFQTAEIEKFNIKSNEYVITIEKVKKSK